MTAIHLREHTEKAVGTRISHEPFGLMAYDGQKLIGSVIGKIFFQWMHLDLIWVDEEYRGQGMGRQLMQMAHEQAEKKGLLGIEVWTQSWQAPEFYRKIGYTEFAVLDDFIPGRKRHAFRLHITGTGI
jgi:ribosomal protein S18 acetylase RimI-like enzyme